MESRLHISCDLHLEHFNCRYDGEYGRWCSAIDQADKLICNICENLRRWGGFKSIKQVPEVQEVPPCQKYYMIHNICRIFCIFITMVVKRNGIMHNKKFLADVLSTHYFIVASALLLLRTTCDSTSSLPLLEQQRRYNTIYVSTDKIYLLRLNFLNTNMDSDLMKYMATTVLVVGGSIHYMVPSFSSV